MTDRKKMNPKIKHDWLKALRSGKYKQGRHALRNYNEEGSDYCCLGVLCDVLDPSGWIPEKNTHKFAKKNERVFYKKAIEIGLTSPTQNFLMERNDNGYWNFNKIANWIEKNI